MAWRRIPTRQKSKSPSTNLAIVAHLLLFNWQLVQHWNMVRQLAIGNIATDRGHTHSDGKSTIPIWVTLRNAYLPTPVVCEQAAPLLRVDVPIFEPQVVELQPFADLGVPLGTDRLIGDIGGRSGVDAYAEALAEFSDRGQTVVSQALSQASVTLDLEFRPHILRLQESMSSLRGILQALSADFSSDRTLFRDVVLKHTVEVDMFLATMDSVCDRVINQVPGEFAGDVPAGFKSELRSEFEALAMDLQNIPCEMQEA